MPKTAAIACRVSLTAYVILKRRADKRGLKVGKYAEKFLETDALRKR